MAVIQDAAVQASESTTNSAGDTSSHSLGPGDTMSIQIQMKPNATKPDLTSYEVTKPEGSKLFFSPPMATVFVGREKVKFLVHQLIICRFSAFLRDAFAEATATDSITFPDAEPKTFSLFVKWAYLATCFFPKLDCLTGTRFASFFDLVKLYVFAQTYDIKAVQDSIVSTICVRLSHDHEIWATLGSDTDLLEYLVGHVGTGARLYTLITRALAYRMFPGAVSQQKGSVRFADGDRTVRFPGRAPDIFPQMPQMFTLHDLAKTQANLKQVLEACRNGAEEEVDMGEVLDTVPATLLRDILKEFFRMKSRGWSANTGFKACVGTDSDFHLPRPAL